ncbi:MAG: sodium-dependent transporter [Eggerthellaceae bacterium]|nr:sodium-dependent transporter [Eggerthellaceae bacterium]
MEREQFGSRLGFILISAGCAIGLGNVWRFPYICGEYGGAAFVLMYLVFLVILGLPIMSMEFAVGRASRRSIARAFNELEPAGARWHRYKWVGIAGNYLLMMFYTTVAGWMLAYVPKMASGLFADAGTAQTAAAFDALLGNPVELVAWMLVAVAAAIAVCSLGLQKGVERVTKVMMLCLLAIIGVLIVRALTLPGAEAGVAFYLAPDFSKIFASPDAFCEAAYAAMGQAFFTLSIGMGSMTIFGSYIGKDRSLLGEAATIGALDTGVALATGLIIFPACFAFGVAPDSGPGLVFITLPSVFEQMWLGEVWGTLFFVFMSFAALSTVIAVFEGILSFAMDEWGWSRRRAVTVNLIAIPLLSLPCALGFNVLSDVVLPGVGDIQSIEDFLVSNNILPLGSLVFVGFCVSRRGWGWDNFLAEANTGRGLRFPSWLRPWMRFGVPTLVLVILAMGWLPIIQVWLGLG